MRGQGRRKNLLSTDREHLRQNYDTLNKRQLQMGMSEAVRPERAEPRVEKHGHTPPVVRGTAVETKAQVTDDGRKDGVLTPSLAVL